MVKLLFYIVVLILWCYVVDFLWLKSWQSFRELKQAYKDLKESREALEEYLK